MPATTCPRSASTAAGSRGCCIGRLSSASGPAASNRPPVGRLRGAGQRARALRVAPDGELVEVEGDALVGADGIHSALRASFYPDEGPPAWNGLLLWRGATDWPVYADGRTMVIAGGNDAKLVYYPIHVDPIDPTGGSPTGGSWRASATDRATARREDWSRPDALTRRCRSPGPRSVGLRRPAGADRGDQHLLRVSLLRPRPGAALVIRAGDAAGRRGPPDVPDRQQRGQPGDPRRAVAGAPSVLRRAGGRGAGGLRRRAPAGDGGDRARQSAGRAGGGDRPGRGSRARRIRRPRRGGQLRRARGDRARLRLAGRLRGGPGQPGSTGAER